MNDECVEVLAEAVGLSLPPERVRAAAELLEALTADGGGVTPEEVLGVEPASAFIPGWPS